MRGQTDSPRHLFCAADITSTLHLRPDRLGENARNGPILVGEGIARDRAPMSITQAARDAGGQSQMGGAATAGLVEGWFFRLNEVSPSHYVAEGVDLYGRTVSQSGSDPDALLYECVRFAKCVLERSGGVIRSS